MAVEIAVERLQWLYEKCMDKIQATAYSSVEPCDLIYYEPVFRQQRKRERHQGKGYAAHAPFNAVSMPSGS